MPAIRSNGLTNQASRSLPTSVEDLSETDRPPSYPGIDTASRPSLAKAKATANTEEDKVACYHDFFLNDTLASLSGRIAANYLVRQQQQQQKQFGNSIFRLPDDLKVAKKSLVAAMSEIYAMTLIVLCLAFTATEIITDKVALDFFESCGFYTYLYSVSVAFMLYLFCYVLRVKSFVSRSSKRKDLFDDGFDVDDFIHRMTLATGLDVKKVQDDSQSSNRFFITPREEGQPNQVVHVKLMTSENEKSHGSLILRIGAIFFGLGTLIYTGLEFLAFFEIPQTCFQWAILFGANPVLYMIFVFMQMYFIFMHSRINIHKNKIVAKFGMMHIIATNACIVIRTLVKESAKEMGHHIKPDNASNSNHPLSNWTRDHVAFGHCERIHIIGEAIESSSIYLYPFIIEYSIIGLLVIYSMWRHVGDNPRYVLLDERSSSDANMEENEDLCEEDVKQNQRQPLDWSSSSFGLFMGLLSLVALIINLIVYFALVNQEEYTTVAILVNNCTDTFINSLMIFAMMIGFFQIRHLDFRSGDMKHEADTTMIITAFGMFAYSTFTVIAGLLNDNNIYEPGELIVTNGIVELFEVQIQLLFIADLRHKKMRFAAAPAAGAAASLTSETLADQERKPGRQIVTFLLVCNLGLWITYNFEMQKVNATPDQVEFYGFLPWIVIQRITLPLCVFFRFHSTVVLSELWKNCYRTNK